ncbi:MAG TPA: glycosyltransferase, partial [Gaiellaceae bacterium]|nr:glycosyltransferase [Gaiellaceae bacterium]
RAVDVHVVAVTATYDDDRRNRAELRDALGGGPVSVERDGSRVASIIRSWRPDVLHVERCFALEHVPRADPTLLLLVEQNIESELCRQRGDLHGWKYTHDLERSAWSRATVCAALTDEDCRVLRRHAVAVWHLPDGCDHLAGPRRDPNPHPTLLFLANFGYAPNRDAVRWLLGEIFPAIRHAMPRVRLQLVGNAPPAGLARDGVVVTGRVPDVKPYVDAAHVVLCPLRVGGGVKVKMLEALSCGKAIVATPIGVQGLDPDVVVVAEDAQTFAAETVRLLGDPQRRRQLEDAARTYAATLPTWDDAADAVLACYDELLRSKSAAWPWPTPTQRVASP